MAFDFKREYREFYMPKSRPEIVDVPKMKFVAVSGRGDPNDEGGAYQRAIGVLYAIAYTVKMSKLGDLRFEGYYDFVVPPLEGFWRQEGADRIDPSRKDLFEWLSVIRVPEFVTDDAFSRAVDAASKKKGIDCSCAELLEFEEGRCVQILHVGSFDSEEASVRLMEEYAAQEGYAFDLDGARRHHEIYLSDARRVAQEKWKTVVRIPIRPVEN